MGFFDKIKSGFKSFGRAIGSGAKKVGSFVKKKALPFIGKVGATARKVGEFINRPEVQGALTALENVPRVGKLFGLIKRAGRLAEVGGTIAEKGAGLTQDVIGAVERKDIGAVPDLVKRGQQFVGQVQGARGQFN